MNQSSEDVKGMMARLLERAKEMRESFGYIQMAPYVEGENDTIKWLEDSPSKPKNNDEHRSKSDLLTDWWK